MAKGSSAVPATPMKSGRIETEGGPTPQTGSGGRLSSISERSVSFDESTGGISEAKDEEVNEYEDSEADGYDFGDGSDASNEARVSAGRSGAPRPITRNLAGKFDEVAKPEPARDDPGSDNEVSGMELADESVIRKLPGNRPPMNSSTPAANRVIGRILDQMMESIDWIRQFTPKAVRQALWVELSGELAWPVNTMSAVKVAEDTMSLLRAMGLETQTNPSEAALRDCPPAIAGKELKRWKRKLRLSFGTSDIGLKAPPTVRPKGDADPSQIPLPQTPKKNEQGKESDDDGVFGVKTEGTPYFQDSHMVTPRSSNRTDRLARDTEASNAQRDAEYDDPSDELARQVREVSEMERLNSTPRLELATHRPLAQIKVFSGLRNKSENSMQWLRTFVYEMKGTRTPPNEWCMAFELRLRDGALPWYRQLPRKTKRRWKLLSDAFIKYYCSQFRQSAKARYYSAKREGNEHVCDYLNRLNGYARNTGVQFEQGGRESKEHVNRFLELCGDRGLERRLCHLRVKEIHELEDIIIDILKSEERGSTRENSANLSRGRDRSHGRDERRAETPRDGYRRDRHDRHERGYDRRMDDSRHTSRISLAEASLSEMMAELQVRESKYGRSERPKSRDMRRSLEDSSGEDAEDRLKMKIDQEAITLIRTTLTSMIAMPRPPTMLSAEPKQSRRTAGLKTAAVVETSPTKGSTATPATKALTDVVVSMGRVQHAGVLTTPPTTVSSVVSYASRCTTPASAKPSRPPTSERRSIRRSPSGVTEPSLQRRFKLGSPPTETGLVPIGLPQLASPREEVKEVNTTEIEKERNGSFGGGESDERKTEEWDSGGSEGLVSSVTQKTWHDYQPENVIKLLSDERLGWWSAQKVDKRVRMRALVQGAVNDARMGILLDTGANVSVISERFAKQLRLREVRDHGRLYEYELWVMDHGAGVDVVLGMDFMIPAGVRLDHFHATSRLPDEDEIPLIKKQRMADTREEGPHGPDGPTEALTIPGHESRGYRPLRQPVTNETHDLWVRRTKESIPKGSEMAQLKLEGAYLATATVSEDWGNGDAPNAAEHPGNAIEFEDYARELAFLPDLTEAASTTLDYTGPHVRHPSLSVDQQDRVGSEEP
ncbi:unnamed protein product [Phytophthora fragariaefolia]|uniref:Unnamed protein product n=1 Tax=Phytophthora fragariaefolia TaxID=1490495 RepID=A0A9W6X5R7_9STRA|nr:unnamed protein product [Phytophthora fragariaefolia]